MYFFKNKHDFYISLWRKFRSTCKYKMFLYLEKNVLYLLEKLFDDQSEVVLME